MDESKLVLPHWNTGDAIGAVIVRDVKPAGDASAGCVWLDFGGVRHAAIWPPGTTATFNPLKIYDSSNNVIWSEGEKRDFGGSANQETDPSGVPERCRNDAAVAVVSQVN
jgi:hypothetical protein